MLTLEQLEKMKREACKKVDEMTAEAKRLLSALDAKRAEKATILKSGTFTDYQRVEFDETQIQSNIAFLQSCIDAERDVLSTAYTPEEVEESWDVKRQSIEKDLHACESDLIAEYSKITVILDKYKSIVDAGVEIQKRFKALMPRGNRPGGSPYKQSITNLQTTEMHRLLESIGDFAKVENKKLSYCDGWFNPYIV